MVTPGLLLLLGLFAFPVLYAFNVSLHDAQYGNLGEFVGLDNYQKIITLPKFSHSFRLTIKFLILSLLLEFPIGMALALAANRATNG